MTHINLHDAQERIIVISVFAKRIIGNFWIMQETTMEAAELRSNVTNFILT